MSPHSTRINGRILDEIRTIPLSYDPVESQQSALQLCLAINPEWENEKGQIEFVPMKDGITNTLIKMVKKRPGYSVEQEDSEAVLIRAYGKGTEVLIDREREITSHSILSKHGLAPPLLARFNNGLLYEFVSGIVCTPEDLIEEPIWRGVACRLGEWHALLPIVHAGDTTLVKDSMEIPQASSPTTSEAESEAMSAITPGKPPPTIWTVMQSWIFNLPTSTNEETERKEVLQKELTRSATELINTPGLGGEGLVLGHCDLLSGNVIIAPSITKSSRQTVNFIDYEYSTPAPVAFDLANHFAEWGGFECNYDNLPTRETRRRFIQEYIKSYTQYAKLDETTEVDYVLRLTHEVDSFRGIPGLYWGIWSLIQATISQIDFDYASYAEIRLAEYFGWRAEQDGSREKAGKEMPLRERRWAEDRYSLAQALPKKEVV